MASTVQFTLNGELQSVNVAEAATKTLNEYIRFNTSFTGTKISCGQGGCGACTVAVAKPSEPFKSIASCITPLASVHGAAIVTVEGLQGADGRPHPVSERMAEFNGTQCGFCTPGMVMQLFSTLSQKDGGKAVNEKELEQCINGNICRCTGYRPIVQCAKSFAAGTTQKNQILPNASIGPYDVQADPKVEFPLRAPLAGSGWLRATSVKEIVECIRKGFVPIAGGTAGGVYPDLTVTCARTDGRSFVDITDVQELKTCSFAEGGTLQIGATTTWNVFVSKLKGLVSADQVQNKEAVMALYERCATIAGDQVRNAGTIGGNIAITRNKGFLSDWVPPLAALGAKVKAVDATGRVLQEELLAFVQSPGPFTGLITSVLLPLPGTDVVFRAFRVSSRSRNAHALINAGMSVSVSGGRISQATLVVGCVDPKPVRLKNTERALVGLKGDDVQNDMSTVLGNLSQKVGMDLFPFQCDFGRDQSAHIICGFLVKLITATFESQVPKDWMSSEYCLHDMERDTEASQTFPVPRELKGAVNKPVMKTAVLEQTSGRAKFTDDMAKPTETLIAAFVVCPEANVMVTKIDCGPAQKLLGDKFHKMVTAKDLRSTTYDGADLMGAAGLPPNFVDNYEKQCFMLLPEGEFCRYGGQPVAVVLARGDKAKLVEAAATACSEALQFERKDVPFIGDLLNCPQVTEPQTFTKGKKPAEPVIAEAKKQGGSHYVSGEFGKKSQVHYYMETQSCWVIPDEDRLTCHIGCQAPDVVQRAISKHTGIQQSKVVVTQRRVGGGFGGKALFPGLLGSITADLALMTKKAVRFVLPRETDMAMVGGRHEMEGNWEAAVDPKTGKITALTYDLWSAFGFGENGQKFTNHVLAAALDECYDIPSITLTCHFSKQHVTDRTFVRAPGHLEASLLMEAVFDGVSSTLNIPNHILRETNFFKGKFNTSGLTGGLLPPGKLEGYSNLAMWKLLKERCNYEARAKAVQDFNKAHQWKKRGISITPARYGLMLAPGNSARVEIFKDGSIQVAVGGCEIGQGLHTKVSQIITTVFERELGAPIGVDQIRFLDTSTEQSPNSTMTGGSVTSEGAMYAAHECCMQLVAKLRPLTAKAKKLKEEEKSKVSFWFDIINIAFSTKFMDALVVPMNLSVSAVHYTPLMEMQYETYGVAAAEVELDVLTGESRVLSTHLMFDSGMSYNPLIDIGQFEGAFIMGLGQVLTEGMEYDRATGKLLTDNTWTYKPPLACDIPEKFTVDLVDMTNQRLQNPIMGCVMGMMGPILGCMGVPWKPTKINPCFKSSRAIGEPPVLLCAAVKSALSAAMVAATGRPLPENNLPIPAKPFSLLPILQGCKPGSGTGADDSSTATGTSASSRR